MSVVQEATEEVVQATREAQAAAGDVVAGISGNDLEALSQLANDARGTWVEVDASGHAVGKGSTSCSAGVCGAEGALGKAAAARGNHYIRATAEGSRNAYR